MFRLFSREEKEPTSKLELINQLETMVFEINDKIKELSSPVHRDKLLFSLSKYSLDDPYNVEGIKDYLTDEIEKLNSIVTNRGQIALILPMLFVISCLKSTSEENQELRNLLFTTSIPMEGLILYSYFSTKYEIYQLNNILELVNKNSVYNQKLAALLSENENFEFREKLSQFINEKNESSAIDRRYTENSTVEYTEWNPRESLIFPTRIGVMRR